MLNTTQVLFTLKLCLYMYFTYFGIFRVTCGMSTKMFIKGNIIKLNKNCVLLYFIVFYFPLCDFYIDMSDDGLRKG